jgi:hypothetical protein
MPKLIDWGVRYELIREAVVRVAARDGLGGVSLPAVAAELRMSPSTLRRTVEPVDALPQMGAGLLARLRRQRRYLRGCPRGAANGSVEHMVWVLTAELPTDEEDLAGQRAWFELTGIGADESSAELRRADETYVDALIAGVLAKLGSDETTRIEQSILLRAVLDGLIAARCRETVTIEAAVECLDRCLRQIPLKDASGVSPDAA